MLLLLRFAVDSNIESFKLKYLMSSIETLQKPKLTEYEKSKQKQFTSNNVVLPVFIGLAKRVKDLDLLLDKSGGDYKSCKESDLWAEILIPKSEVGNCALEKSLM
ncbi:hypothetical protein BB560_001349, partial [Smittium megazygosporum]